MPSPTARPRGGVVGRARKDLVSCGEPSRCGGDVGVFLLFGLLGGLVGESQQLFGGKRVVPWSIQSERGRSPDFERAAAVRTGSAMRESDRVSIWFGLCGAAPRRKLVGWVSIGFCYALCRRDGDGGWRQGRPAIRSCVGAVAESGSTRLLSASWWWRCTCRPHTWLGLGNCWAWALAQDLYYVFAIFYGFLLLVKCGFMPEISPYRVVARRRGLGPGLHLVCAWSVLGRLRVPCFCNWLLPSSGSNVSALGWRRVPCLVKWSLPPSGRVKLSVAGCLVQWQHDGKAVRMEIMLSCNRVADQVIFPSCHRCVTYVKANRVASRALFASWCLVEYSCLLETHDSISGCSLVAYCNQGFWFIARDPPCIRQFQ